MVSIIKTTIFAVVITAVSIVFSNAQKAPKWEIDKAHTSVNFSVNHFFSPVVGKFDNFGGTIYFDPHNLKGSKVEFWVDVKSINTGNKERDKHLLTKDFFDANKYPKMYFKSTKFEKKSDKEILVHGKLTIKDKTKNVVIPVKITGEMEHPMKKGVKILGVLIDTTINRTEYGVGTGDWAATMVIGDEVKVHIPMELNRKK